MADAWNHFVAQSKNGTFLLDRRYMDYHADRFEDHSLMVYRQGKLYALLPGNVKNGIFYSHQGLTYGGLMMNEKATAAEVTSIFFQLNDMLREEAIKKVVYKPIPWIYHQQPAEEDLYAIMKVCQAKIIARNLSSAISKKCPNKWYRIRECGSRKASAAGLSVEESEDWKAFWDILADNLLHKYQLAPVHTVNELLLLHQRFPKQIRLVVVKEGQTVIGGTVLYVTNCVVHSQYIAANERGKELHALDLLFDQVISKSLSGHAFFDFGISTEEHGTYLNEKLIYQKEGFGGRGICYDWYEWDL